MAALDQVTLQAQDDPVERSEAPKTSWKPP